MLTRRYCSIKHSLPLVYHVRACVSREIKSALRDGVVATTKIISYQTLVPNTHFSAFNKNRLRVICDLYLKQSQLLPSDSCYFLYHTLFLSSTLELIYIPT